MFALAETYWILRSRLSCLWGGDEIRLCQLMRDSGIDRFDCCRILQKAGWDYKSAKILVYAGPVWKELIASTVRFHDELEDAATELQRSNNKN